MEPHRPPTIDLGTKTAVVTGAASGIGRSIALALARHGAAVVVADLRREPREGGKPTDTLITEEAGGRALFVECDVSDRAAVGEAVAAADPWGGVDVMVNNAGIFRSEDFLAVRTEEFARMMDVNVAGVFYGCQAAAKRMKDGGGGSIINMSSVAGLQGSGGHASYCASKGAVRLLTYALADELGPDGIRVNAIHPGLIDTEMTTTDVEIIGTEAGESFLEQIPLGRDGSADDIADAAVFLASDLSGYVNGASIVVDGGLSRF